MKLEDRLRKQWTESAQDWIESDQAVRIDFLDSWMLDGLGDISGKSVIDIGCGEGRFSRLLAGLGATVTGVDLTEELVERAGMLGSKNETYLIGDAENLDCIVNDSFDLAVSYIVLVDLLDYRQAIKEAYRVLRPGGRFTVCNIHPMRSSVIGWVRQGRRKLFYPVDDYMNEGQREWIWWDKEKPFINIHVPLSRQVSAYLDAGFVLEALREPTPSEVQLEAHPNFDDDFRAPNFIIYVLRKPTA